MPATSKLPMPTHPFAGVMIDLALLMTMSVVARWLASRYRQPAVLGELVIGVLVGNLGYWLGLPFFRLVMSYAMAGQVFERVWRGDLSPAQAAGQVFGPADLAPGGPGHAVLALLSGPQSLANVNTGVTLWLFSSLGVILLLFHVGLKTGVDRLRQVGAKAARVAVSGALGTVAVALATLWLMPVALSGPGRFFVAATLAATSFGISTRLLEDIGKADTPEGRIVLGACVLNDVIGLVLLALAIELSIEDRVELPEVAWLLASSALLLGAIVIFADRLGGPLARQLNRINPEEVRFLAPLAFAFLLGWLCSSLGLSGTVGGFAAGLVLSDEALRDKTKEMLVPLIAVLTPVFFLLIGMQVNLAVFLQWKTLLLTLALLLAAVLGKLPAALAAGPGVDRLAIALGMLPRGEVALLFVGVGRSLGVIDDSLFAALVAVVVLLAFGSGVALKGVFGPRSARADALFERLRHLLAHRDP
jgi:Kef-type K+ transport system membrane component KefB